MAVVDLSALSESLASIFKDELVEQFARTAIFPRPLVERTVAEEEENVACPVRPERRLLWDLDDF